MPFVRRRFRRSFVRRRFVRRRRLPMSRSFRFRRRLPNREPVHYFTRKATLTPQVVANTSTTGYLGVGLQWQLSDVPNVTEFTNLYDQYKILRIKTYIVARALNLSMNEAAAGGNIGMPNIIAAEDLDDSNAPANTSAGYQLIQQYARSKAHSFTPEKRVFRWSCVPAVSGMIFEGLAATAYSPKRFQWLSTTDPATPHYGLKYVIQVPFSGATVGIDVVFDVFSTFKLAMRGTK